MCICVGVCIYVCTLSVEKFPDLAEQLRNQCMQSLCGAHVISRIADDSAKV